MTHPAPDLSALGDLAPGARRILEERGVVRTFEEGRVLWRAGGRAASVHLVLEGEVKIVRTSEDGRQHVVHRGGAGATLGEVPFFADGGYPATAVAVRPTRCLVVDRRTLEAAMAADPALAWHFLETLARRVRHLVERLDARSIEDVRTRLERYLEVRSEEAGGGWFRLGLTQAELAEELGTVREVLVRALGTLRRSGALEHRGGRYRLAEADELE